MQAVSNQSSLSLPDGKGLQLGPSKSPIPQPQGDKGLSAEEVAQKLANNNEFIEKVLTSPQFESELAEHLSKGDFIGKMLASSQFKSELAKYLSKEYGVWVGWSLVLAIFSFLIMGGVYGLSLLPGGTDAVKTFAIGAFCLVILVINVAFSLMVLKVIR